MSEVMEAAGRVRLPNMPTLGELMKSREEKLPDFDLLSLEDEVNDAIAEDNEKEDTVYSMEDCYDDIDAMLDEEST